MGGQVGGQAGAQGVGQAGAQEVGQTGAQGVGAQVGGTRQVEDGTNGWLLAARISSKVRK